MKRYLELLRSCNEEDFIIPRAPNVAAWLTGQSSYEHSHLEPDQLKMLDHLESMGWRAVRAGFPYNRRALKQPFRRPGLLASSWRNAEQYVASLWSDSFRRQCARHLQALLDRAGERLLLLLGSCGAEIFLSCHPLLIVPERLRISLVALGPVGHAAKLPSGVRMCVIRGDGDWISRLFGGWPSDLRVSGGHMDYAARPETPAAITRALGLLDA
jgi:hypothetical protein